MTAATTHSLVDLVSQFHRQLAQHCSQTARLNQDERVRLLLDYVGRHETHLAAALQSYENQAREKILATWFRNAPTNALPRLDQHALSATSTVDDVIEWAVEMDNAIISFYRTLATEAETPDLKKVLDNLLAMEESEQHRMVRSALRIQDF